MKRHLITRIVERLRCSVCRCVGGSWNWYDRKMKRRRKRVLRRLGEQGWKFMRVRAPMPLSREYTMEKGKRRVAFCPRCSEHNQGGA